MEVSVVAEGLIAYFADMLKVGAGKLIWAVFSTSCQIEHAI